MQQAIEQEVTDYLGRERYARQAKVNGYRNGYKPGRIRSAEGEIALAVPQVCGSGEPYRRGCWSSCAAVVSAGIPGDADVQPGAVDTG